MSAPESDRSYRQLIDDTVSRGTLPARALAPSGFALVKAHPVITLAILAILLVAGLYFGSAVLVGIRQSFEDRKVEKLDKKGDDAVEQKDSALRDADAAAGERKTEDAIRDRMIKPEIQRTSRNLEASSARARQAQIDYEKARNAKFNTDRDPDTGALHHRNCADLRELYPGEPVPGCDR